MAHIINQTILYSPTERTLCILNETDLSVTLSKPAARLLLELIKNNKEIVTRNHLMTHVWEDYGFNGSNNNLNGCISEIRKALESLGVKPQVLITIPKVGFIFDADIGAPPPPPNIHTNPGTAAACPVRNTKSIRQIEKYRIGERRVAIALILIVSGCCIAFIFLLAQNKTYSFEKADLYYLYKDKKCDVFTLDSHYLYAKSELVKQAKEDLKNEKIDCDGVEKDIFYSKVLNRNMPLQVTFIAVCAQSSRGDYRYCQTIKNVEGVTQ